VIKHSDFEKKWQDPLRQVLNKVDLGIDDEWYRIDAVLRFLSNELQVRKLETGLFARRNTVEADISPV